MTILLKLTACVLLTTTLPAQGRRSSDSSLRLPPPASKNPFATAEDVQLGARLFQTHCSYCHGTNGEGGRGPDHTHGQYRYSGSYAELFSTIRDGIPGSEMPPVRASDDDVWRMVGFVNKIGSAGLEEKAHGDAAAGKLVYENKGGCAACHVIGNRGGSLGPDLTSIGWRRGSKYLDESLVSPEADLPINYRYVRVITTTGQTIVGIRLNEDDISIQVRDIAENLRSFLKDDLKEIRRDQPSLMPAYGAVLSKKEMEDLVAYLSSLRGPR